MTTPPEIKVMAMTLVGDKPYPSIHLTADLNGRCEVTARHEPDQCDGDYYEEIGIIGYDRGSDNVAVAKKAVGILCKDCTGARATAVINYIICCAKALGRANV